MKNKYDVLVLGEINADLVMGPDAAPIFGQTEKLVDDATLTMGSSGVIFACGAARLGLRVGYCGVVGDDMFGRFMLQAMTERGVDTAGVIVDRDVKTGLSVILNIENDRAILTHMGAISALSAEQIDTDLLSATRHVHLTSYFLQTALQPGLPKLLRLAMSQHATVSLDTNWDPAEDWDNGLENVLPLLDILLPNAQEACAIARQPNLDTAIESLAITVPTVAVKLGAKGAICAQEGLITRDPGFPVEVVDTTGAGDSFDAGFIYGFICGLPVAESLALGCACGSLSTRSAGGTQAQPTLFEAEKLIGKRRPLLDRC